MSRTSCMHVHIVKFWGWFHGNPHMHVYILAMVHEFIMFLSELTHLIMYWKLWFQLNTCMSYVRHVLEVLFGNGFNWTTFGLWFLKLIFETCHIMSLQVFSRKLAQKDRIWCIGTWFEHWSSNLDFPDFGLPLERGKWSSSGEFELPASCTVLQSARAD